jgi:hypothetical protein
MPSSLPNAVVSRYLHQSLVVATMDQMTQHSAVAMIVLRTMMKTGVRVFLDFQFYKSMQR